MKSKKVLIGLIVAAFVGGAHFASAQSKANYQNNLIEVGPDNIAGRVRAIVVDNADPNHTTLYAGGVAGGLFKKTGDEKWQYLPYISGNKEITLPISCMIQLPDNSLLIGTGEGFVDEHGVNLERMSPKGRGVYHFNPNDNSFTLLSKTNPSTNPEWSYINRMALLERDNYLYIYAATNEGLYRWKLSSSNPDWNATPSLVQAGCFHDVIIISADNIAYATTPGKIYRVGNVTGEGNAVDVTSSNTAFANSSRIELAANTAHAFDSTLGTNVHTTYLYALVSDSNGLLDGVFLTNNQQTWTRLTTSTVSPFTKENPGTLNSAIAINPRHYKEIYVGGATLWSGEGFVENSYYQWIKQSYSESELNSGNYMASVYSNPMCLHSGIHQIVPTWTIKDGDTVWMNYYATDGGVYADANGFTGYFRSLNKGLNTVQFNHIAVTPDGSLIGGAVDNGCPFIQTRNDHDGSVPTNSWYDNDPNSVMNHMGNVLWLGNGGGVAASMFQQILPFTRRSIIVSAEPGHFSRSSSSVASFGRACADYTDYTNTQTWTYAEAFLSDIILNSNQIPQIRLWETTNNTIWNDSMTFTIDTNSTYIHNGQELQLTGNTQIKPGDSILVVSKPNFDYPFYYRFNETFTVKNKMNHKIQSPVVSRVILNARMLRGNGSVYMNMTPNYYRNVWDENEATSTDDATIEKLMHWVKIFEADLGHSVGDIAFSRDGKSIFINVVNDSTGRNFVFRLYDFTNADVNHSMTYKSQLQFVKDDYVGNPCITHFDTILATDGNWFNRPLTSISVDPRPGQDNLVLTFGGYSNDGANMVYVKNATTPATRTVTNINVTNGENSMLVSDPVYSSLIECTTGAIYAGTEKGVFASPSAVNPSWQNFGAFNGVPVTSIVQQTQNLKRQRYTVREGVNDVTYLYAKTKYPYAIYFGTYGRGIFMDTTYVTDHENEICNEEDWLGITNVDNGENRMNIYPNPAADIATIDLGIVNAGNAVVKIYDITGKMVHSEKLGYLSEGSHQYTIDCTKFAHGMYLVNVNIGKESATSKLIVR
ncbi:MAG: T9SS type A sorting domain-containing protein [Bacteroidales bacterium]|nr:T9SS type A sorting domain-containing protein [Bacteroidales bacterium]